MAIICFILGCLCGNLTFNTAIMGYIETTYSISADYLQTAFGVLTLLFFVLAYTLNKVDMLNIIAVMALPTLVAIWAFNGLWIFQQRVYVIGDVIVTVVVFAAWIYVTPNDGGGRKK